MSLIPVEAFRKLGGCFRFNKGEVRNWDFFVTSCHFPLRFEIAREQGLVVEELFDGNHGLVPSLLTFINTICPEFWRNVSVRNLHTAGTQLYITSSTRAWATRSLCGDVKSVL